MRHAFNCYLTSGNEPEKRTNSRAVRVAKRAAISSDSYADERKDVVRASVSTRTIDYRARSDIVTLSGRSVVRQVDGNGVARSDDLLRARIRKKLISVLPLTIDAYVQKTEVYHSALQTTYRLSTIRQFFVGFTSPSENS